MFFRGGLVFFCGVYAGLGVRWYHCPNIVFLVMGSGKIECVLWSVDLV